MLNLKTAKAVWNAPKLKRIAVNLAENGPSGTSDNGGAGRS